MRRSILQFKKLHTASFNFLGCLCILGVLTGMISCHQVTRSGIGSFGGLSEPPEPLRIFGSTAAEPARLLFTVDRDICSHPKNPVIAKVSLVSAMGEHLLSLTQHPDGEILAHLGGQEVRLNQPLPFDIGSLGKYCPAEMERKPDDLLQVQGKDAIQLQQSLALLLPSCRILLPETDRWHCKMPVPSVRKMAQEVASLHKSLLRTFRRHPYLMLRRAAISIQLAKVLTSAKPMDGLDRFCRLVDSSLPDELPIALRSEAWRGAACNAFGNRLEAAHWGLEQSVAEVKNLMQYLKKGSYRGVLSLKLPREAIPDRDLWVVLDPVQLSASEESNASLPVCFHPAYLRPDHHRVAIHLDLAAPTTASLCEVKDPEPAKAQDFFRRYLFASIASETEFPISNGRGKVLRLPVGQYRYTVKKNQQSLSQDPIEAETESVGRLSWGRKAGNPTLRKW